MAMSLLCSELASEWMQNQGGKVSDHLAPEEVQGTAAEAATIPTPFAGPILPYLAQFHSLPPSLTIGQSFWPASHSALKLGTN